MKPPMADRIDGDNGGEHHIICQMDLQDTVQEIKRQAGHAGIRGGKARENHQTLMDLALVPMEKTETSKNHKFRERSTDQRQARQSRAWHMVSAKFGGHDGGRHSHDENHRQQGESEHAQTAVKIRSTRRDQGDLDDEQGDPCRHQRAVQVYQNRQRFRGHEEELGKIRRPEAGDHQRAHRYRREEIHAAIARSNICLNLDGHVWFAEQRSQTTKPERQSKHANAGDQR